MRPPRQGTPDIENVKRYNVKGWKGASTHPTCYVLTFNVFVFTFGKGEGEMEKRRGLCLEYYLYKHTKLIFLETTTTTLYL